jgi:hypothetical protein
MTIYIGYSLDACERHWLTAPLSPHMTEAWEHDDFTNLDCNVSVMVPGTSDEPLATRSSQSRVPAANGPSGLGLRPYASAPPSAASPLTDSSTLRRMCECFG